MRRSISCIAAWLALALPAIAQAADEAPGADFPTLPIHWIVPFPPAGSIDAVARVVGRKLSEILGQQIIIDNRAGAGGRVGAKAAADARPDGYTQLFTLNTTYTIKKQFFAHPTFDPDKDFEPISIVAETSQLLVASPGFPAHNVQELIAMAKKQPHEINFASSGVGGSLHLAMMYFESQAGIDLVHIPYKGGPPAVNDLMTDRVSLMFFNTPAALNYVKNHQFQALAVSTKKRSIFLPDVPTIAESGVPGFDISVWFGLSVPAGTPHAVIDRMHAAVVKALADPRVRHDLIALGAEPVGDAPADFAQRVHRESEGWTKTFKQADMVLE